MDTRKPHLFRHTIILCLAGIVSGCSIIGMAAGSKTDIQNEKPRKIQGWSLAQLDEGMIIEIVLKDSTTYNGQFLGMKSASANESNTVPGQLVEQDKVSDIYPEIGDSIMVHMKNDRSLWFLYEGHVKNTLKIRNPRTDKKVSIGLNRIHTITDTEETKILDESISVSAEKTKSLYPDRISLMEKGKSHLIDPDSVATLTLPGSKTNYAFQGFIGGLVLDVLVVVVITSIKESFKMDMNLGSN